MISLRKIHRFTALINQTSNAALLEIHFARNSNVLSREIHVEVWSAARNPHFLDARYLDSDLIFATKSLKFSWIPAMNWWVGIEIIQLYSKKYPNFCPIKASFSSMSSPKSPTPWRKRSRKSRKLRTRSSSKVSNYRPWGQNFSEKFRASGNTINKV